MKKMELTTFTYFVNTFIDTLNLSSFKSSGNSSSYIWGDLIQSFNAEIWAFNSPDTKTTSKSKKRIVCINPHLPDVRVEDMGAEKVSVTKKVEMRRVVLSRDIIVMKIYWRE